MKRLMLFCMLVTITGCATRPTSQEAAAADYGRPMEQEECETLVRQTMEMYLKDPDSAKYRFGPCQKKAAASAPIYGVPKQYGYGIIVEINARNSFGGYTGPKPYTFLIKDGVVIRRTKPDDDMPDIQYPF